MSETIEGIIGDAARKPESDHMRLLIPELPAAKEEMIQRKKIRDFRETTSKVAAVTGVALQLDAMAGNPVLERMKSFLLDSANLPVGKFTYSKALYEIVNECSQNLTNALFTLENIEDSKQYKRKFLQIVARGELYIDRILQQFIRDNASKEMFESFKKKRFERVKDAYHLDLLGGQLGILKAIITGQDTEALRLNMAFVKKHFFGLPSDMNAETEEEQSLLETLAGRNIALVEEKLYPLLNRKITEFAQSGWGNQFVNGAKRFGTTMKDWVSTPFSQPSCDRMSEMLLPVAYLGVGPAVMNLYPLLRDIVHIGWNVSVNKGMALEMLSSCVGAVSFDAALCAASFGAGAVIKSVQGTQAVGTVATSLSVLNGVRIGTNLGRSALSPMRTTSRLSLLDLEKAQQQTKTE